MEYDLIPTRKGLKLITIQQCSMVGMPRVQIYYPEASNLITWLDIEYSILHW